MNGGINYDASYHVGAIRSRELHIRPKDGLDHKQILELLRKTDKPFPGIYDQFQFPVAYPRMDIVERPKKIDGTDTEAIQVVHLTDSTSGIYRAYLLMEAIQARKLNKNPGAVKVVLDEMINAWFSTQLDCIFERV